MLEKSSRGEKSLALENQIDGTGSSDGKVLRFARENGTISEDVVRNAFSATEDGFLALVQSTHQTRPLIAAIGSCCLVGVIWKGQLYVANLGDSRAVIGSLGGSNIISEQLTSDHNADMVEVRQELSSLHPDDSQIVVFNNGAWRIKGIIEVLRAIGDAYLKRPEFAMGPSFPCFHLSEPLRRPILTVEPSIFTRVLQPQDKFLIFASDGLWHHLTNQEAIEIVHNHPRKGIARILVTRALLEAARKGGRTYVEIKQLGGGLRRPYHDDITVVVIFIEHELLMVPNASISNQLRHHPVLSYVSLL